MCATSTTFTYNSIGLPATETVTYQIATYSDGGNPTDPDQNGDVDAVTGSITFNLSYGPPGRYGMRVLTIAGGSGAQSITQD